ncbi:MAG: hypothetical protein COT85_02415 [Chlamydiae bacterium CG10_big_fil_rev_8_21_14_0_10_42_34]|nr:MAG: hypothetical protein COT85_02415 [Chlamydiae bacterium CG10_big_fil_rev_8_21_14_0_10_42_34]
MKLFFFLFLTCGLFATVNEPLRCEVFSGYRNDRIHWHLQNAGDGGALTYRELYRDIQYWENGLTLKVIHRDLTFYMRGSYGTFGRGTVSQRYPNITSRFHFDTEGWTADAVGYFGYAVNLTAGRTYKVLLVPLVGYSAYFEQLRRGDSTQTLGSFSTSLPGTFRLVWNGFLVGAGITVETTGRFVFNVGYSHHFIHNRIHTKFKNSTVLMESVKTSSGGNGGQTGWAQIDWIADRLWRIGIGSQIHYFSTRVVDAKIEQSNVPSFSEKLKLRWTSVSGWAQISRQF